jgi:hypothetical protein
MPSSNEPTKKSVPPSTTSSAETADQAPRKFTEEELLRQLKALKRIMPSVAKKKTYPRAHVFEIFLDSRASGVASWASFTCRWVRFRCPSRRSFCSSEGFGKRLSDGFVGSLLDGMRVLLSFGSAFAYPQPILFERMTGNPAEFLRKVRNGSLRLPRHNASLLTSRLTAMLDSPPVRSLNSAFHEARRNSG